MSKAVLPKGQRTTKRRGKQKAYEAAAHYSIYVNPIASEMVDPEHLQARAFPVLEAWREDGVLKEQVLKAVIHYNDGPQTVYVKETSTELVEAIAKRLESIVSRISAYVGDNAGSSALHMELIELVELEADLEEFGGQYLSYGDD